jgi:pSer/pThr/pTyr-binding forkhead associated (FHA) protein
VRPPQPTRQQLLLELWLAARPARRPHHHPHRGRPAAGRAGPDDDLVIPVGELAKGAGVLIVRAGAQAGARFTLDTDITRLGRHPDSEISLDDITVSRRHAEVQHREQGYVVADSGSLNGTYVNQERVERATLRHGDEVQIGKFRLVFFERADG